MKLATKERKIERNQKGSDTRFSMVMTAKAVEVLSASLYEEPIAAILRELGTNAMDSHVDAGKPTQAFEVHLPSTMEPYFYLRDFGTGISDGHMKQVYTVYFASDKTHRDDLTGCLGLGSKSPFSYTDQFMVTSIHKGMRRIYNIFKDEDGVPTLTKMSEEETVDTSGVEVRFAVKSNDFESFHYNSTRIYQWFHVRPTFTNEDCKLPVFDKTLRGNKWFVLNDNSKGFNVLMGNIRYHVERNKIPENVIKQLDEKKAILLDCGIFFEADIGDFSMAANRESLHFNQHTEKSLVKTINHIYDDIVNDFNEKISNAESLWQANIVVAKMSKWNWTSRLINAGFITWNGHHVVGNIRLKDKVDVRNESSVKVFEYQVKYGVPDKSGNKGLPVWHIYKDTRPTSILATGHTELFIKDNRSYCNQRIMQYLCEARNSHTEKYLYIIDPEYLPNSTDKFLDTHQLRSHLRKVSELPKPPTNSPLYPRSKSAQVLHMWNTNVNHVDDNRPWRETEISPEDDDGVYVAVSGQSWNSDGLINRKGSDLIRLADAAQGLTNIKTIDIIGVRNRTIDQFENNPNWTPFVTHIRNLIKQNANLIKGVTDVYLWNSIEKLKGYNTAGLNDWSQLIHFNELNHYSPVRKFLKILKELNEARDNKKVQSLIAIESLNNGIKLPHTKASRAAFEKKKKEVEKMYHAMENRYWLSSSIKNTTYRIDKKKLFQFILYINAVDSQLRSKSNNEIQQETEAESVVS